jgi:hypothetical protein
MLSRLYNASCNRLFVVSLQAVAKMLSQEIFRIYLYHLI